MNKKVILCLCALFLISCKNENNSSLPTISESLSDEPNSNDNRESNEAQSSNEESSSTVYETDSSNDNSGWLPDIRP